MMNYKNAVLLFLFATATVKVGAQDANPSISVLPTNSGIVAVGATLDLIIDVGNTGTTSIPLSKIRPNVTVPASVTFLPNAEQTLPAGWSIVNNTGSQLRVCNTGFVVPGQTSTAIILKVRGVTVTPAQPFTGQMAFGNGLANCLAGPSVAGNNTADDQASSSIQVISAPLPLTLVSFNAALVNCKAALKWLTESEINTGRFQIERNDVNSANAGWKTVGELPATGTISKSSYNYVDATLDAASAKVFYRLKIIDKDGSYQYSDILTLAVNCKTTQVVVYPNPVRNGRVHVTLSGATGVTEAVVMNATGQQVFKSTITNGSNYLNVSNIAEGVYYLHIKETNGADKKVKLLIQK